MKNAESWETFCLPQPQSHYFHPLVPLVDSETAEPREEGYPGISGFRAGQI